MRRASRTRPAGSRRPYYRPHLVTLEERLPLGDGVLGLLVGAALLPAHAGSLAAVSAAAPSSGERGVSTPRLQAVTGGFTPPARPDEVFAGALADSLDTAVKGDPPTDFRARPSQVVRGTLFPSPQREQGPDSPPLLARRALDAHAGALPTARPAPAGTSDVALLATLVGMRPSAAPPTSGVTPTQEAQVKENFGKRPLYFEENAGQTDASVHYFARGPGYGLYLTSTEAVLVLNKPTGAAGGSMLSRPWEDSLMVPDRVGRESMAPAATAQEAQELPAVVRMQLIGANAAPAVTGRDEQPGKVNYLLGNDPAKWHTNVATFGRVEYDEVYPGIDLVWYGSNRQMEYDFVVSPGADPSQVRLRFAHAEHLELDAAGNLVVTAGGQQLRQHKPFVYQTVDGARQEVASRFVLVEPASGVGSAPRAYEVGFAVGAYDVGRPLVIDPVLSYSTYLGGSGQATGSGLDDGIAVAVDGGGNAYVTGQTTSTNFPTANPFQAGYGGGVCGPLPCWDAFVTKLSASGDTLVYSTYLGGSGTDHGYGLAVDGNGNAYVTGITASTNFPTANPFQPSNRGAGDAFVARLSASGSALVYSTYLGGSGQDVGYGLAVDGGGDAFLTGSTASTTFPTANPFQPSNRGGVDAFLARLNASGSTLIYSTYLGGDGGDIGYGLAVEGGGNAFVTGSTSSTNFPTANPFQPSNRGGIDAFVAKLTASGSTLVYSTYLGGSSAEPGRGIAVDGAGNALVTGWTFSTDFPTANPFQPSCAGASCWDAFVARLNAAGNALVYSTYLGGGGEDYGYGLAVDGGGNAFVTGATASADFPTANPLQPTLRGFSDAFVAKLSAAGSTLAYSTYLGGGGGDSGRSLAVDGSGNAFVTGSTSSTDFPTANPFQPSRNGQTDAFVSRVSPSTAAYFYIYPDSGPVQAGVPIDLYVFALDAQFNIIEDYTGLILFWATDPQAQTPGYHSFEPPNPGYAYFAGGLTFNTPGVQELYVFDWPGVQVFGYAAFDVRP